MTDSLNEYTHGPADWRKVIRQNSRRTYFVIALFFFIYVGIGLMVDMYIYAGQYPQASMSQLLMGLATFQLFPLVSLILLGVAGISLFVAYTLHDKLMLLGTEYHEVTPETAQTIEEKKLYNVVEEMKVAAGMRYMPKVYIIDADYMNAFASGYSERSAMVAITRGLMQKLNRDELQAVMAHEISHIRHMDIKLTLTASLLANMTIMVLDMFFYNAIFSSRRREDGESRNTLFIIIMILRYVLPIISVILLLYLSRKRETMADAGCVELTRTNEPLARALIKIQEDTTANRTEYAAQYQQTPHENVRREAYIFDPAQAGIANISSIGDFFSTHPSLEERLAALGFIKK